MAKKIVNVLLWFNKEVTEMASAVTYIAGVVLGGLLIMNINTWFPSLGEWVVLLVGIYFLGLAVAYVFSPMPNIDGRVYKYAESDKKYLSLFNPFLQGILVMVFVGTILWLFNLL